MCSHPCAYKHVNRVNKPMSYHPFGINPDNITNGPMGECYDKNIRNAFYVYACQFNEASANNLSFINKYHVSATHKII